VLASAGLRAFDVEEWPTHGGSLRLFVCRKEASHAETEALRAMRVKERDFNLDRVEGYEGFAEKVATIRLAFRDFLSRAKAEGKKVAAYGAAAKGNTFLNVCGVTHEDIACVFDLSDVKQGRYLPGSHIPILAPSEIATVRPDYLVILPWNLREEIMKQMAILRSWGGKFVTAVPTTRVYE